MRKLLLYILILFTAAPLVAQTVHVSVPRHVAVGQEFRLEYTVNNNNVEELQPGAIPRGLEVLYGPSQSRSSSYQFINGHAMSSSSVTISYILVATHHGTFNIGGAKAIINGRRVSSPGVRITATGNAAVSTRHGANSYGGQTEEMGEEEMDDERDELFIKVSANKRRLYEQEPVLLTYKVYTTLPLTQLEGKMPELTGFHSQEIKLPQPKSFHKERLGGRVYNTVVCSQYLMYPQMTGNLRIPPITFRGIVSERRRNIDPIDAFFNGQSGVVESQRNIKAPGLTIHVDPLPAKPAGFSGGVGQFNISAQTDKSEVKAGQPVNLRIVVGGLGNLKLIKQPQVSFPQSFDHYDPKVTDKTRITARGVEGNMIYDILTVPRQEGKYTIPPVKFIYYDTKARGYKTQATKAMTINVLKGNSDSSDGLADNAAEEDIKPIHTGKDVSPVPENGFFFGSPAYCVVLALLIVAFVVLIVMFRKRAMELANTTMARGHRASKVASRKMRTASLLMLKGDRTGFYDEVLHALWGYAGDKLGMPSEELNRDNIAEKLEQRGISKEVADKFIKAIDESEFERYAPSGEAMDMNHTLELAMTAIMDIENALKVKKQGKAGGTAVLVAVLLLLPMGGHAISKQNADNEYLHGNYQQAVADYKELIKEQPSADLYYNLANAYYRTDNLTQAILNYERALRLNPGNRDIRWNLQVVSAKTIDKIDPEPEFFLTAWWHAAVNLIGVDGWAVVSIVSMLMALLLALAYLFCSTLRWRKIGFFGGCAFLVLFILSVVFGHAQKQEIEDHVGAVITAPSVNVRETPSMTGRSSFVLHEGTKVDITDSGMKGWRMVKVADGRQGWMRTAYLEEI